MLIDYIITIVICIVIYGAYSFGYVRGYIAGANYVQHLLDEYHEYVLKHIREWRK